MDIEDFEVPAKLCTPDKLQEVVRHLPRPLVFTNGVFDLLHRGHVAYLAQARQLGGSLVVGLNSDASVRLLGKGPDRPLNPELDRAWVLSALESVSAVVIFDEQTPVRLLAEIKPDIYVKGGDYDMEALPETALVQGWGGRSVAMPFVNERSSSHLVRKIRQG